MCTSFPRRDGRLVRAVVTRALLLALFLAVQAKTSRSDATLREEREELVKEVNKTLGGFLDGRKLKVAAKVDEGPFADWKGSGSERRLSGISIDQMDKLSKKYGFKIDGEIFEANGTFDEIVADVGNGRVWDPEARKMRDVDVVVQLFTATGVRSLTATQTASPIDSEMVFLARKLTRGQYFGLVFKQFTGLLWFLLFLILGLLTINLAYFNHVDEEKPEKFIRLVWKHLYNLACLLFGQLPISPDNIVHAQKGRGSSPTRLIYILFKAFCFGLSAFYTALVITQFQNKEESAMVSMKKFCTAPLEGKALMDLHVAKGTSFQAYVQNYLRENKNICVSITDDERKLFDDGGANVCDSAEECRNRVIEGKAHATLEDEPQADWLLGNNGDCKILQKVGLTGRSSASTWLLPKGDGYNGLAESLSNAILLARDDGSFDRITRDAIDKGGCKKEHFDRVNIWDLQGFLYVMLGTWLLALAVHLFKWAFVAKAMALLPLR